jgi:hypothetical protein
MALAIKADAGIDGEGAADRPISVASVAHRPGSGDAVAVSAEDAAC